MPYKHDTQTQNKINDKHSRYIINGKHSRDKHPRNKIDMNNRLSTLNAEIVILIFSTTYCLLYRHYP